MILERFWSKVEKTDTCWVWKSVRTSRGYGCFTAEGKNHVASRFIYATLNGPIPAGMFVCHSCDNPPCVRPDHLWLGTHKQNMEDAARKKRLPSQFDNAQKKKTACPSGHPYDDSNTRFRPNGHRVCMECERRNHRNLSRDQKVKYVARSVAAAKIVLRDTCPGCGSLCGIRADGKYVRHSAGRSSVRNALRKPGSDQDICSAALSSHRQATAEKKEGA